MAKNPFSKTQIDRLGDRLKSGPHTETDLRLLDDYRRSFGEAYETVAQRIRHRGEFPTGRLAKSTQSIVEKLRRESIRLSQIQDIAGCRVVLVNILRQEQFVVSLKEDFPDAAVIDRREKPSHGYRAIHVIIEISGKAVEIQVRSSLQHLWAEVSEKSADVLDPAIKYGGGPGPWRDFLAKCSKSVATFEEFEIVHSKAVALKVVADAPHENFRDGFAKLREHDISDEVLQEMQGKFEDSERERERREQVHEKREIELARLRIVNAELLSGAISQLEKIKGQKQ